MNLANFSNGPLVEFSNNLNMNSRCPTNSLEVILTNFVIDLAFRKTYTKTRIRQETGVDLTKYYNGGSIPTINSLTKVFEFLELSPGCVVLLAYWVSQDFVSYSCAIEILANWNKYQHLHDSFQFGIIHFHKEQ